MSVSAHPRPVISGIAYELGSLERVADLDTTENDAGAVQSLLAAGMHSFSRSSRRINELAAHSMRRTLDLAGLAPSDVDMVLYGTESFWDASQISTHRETTRQFRQDIFRTIYEIGLRQAFPLGVTFSGCGNFVSSIKLAASMLLAGQARNVLVVAGDRQPPGKTRVLPPAVTVLSDGVASCVVSCDSPRGFAIMEVCQHAFLQVLDVTMEDDFGRFLVEMARTIKSLGMRMQKSTGRKPSQYRRLLVNNYNLSTARVFSHVLGYESSHLYLDNISRIGHVTAADALINLADLDRAGGIEDGDHVMVLGTGPVTSGLMDLCKVFS